MKTMIRNAVGLLCLMLVSGCLRMAPQEVPVPKLGEVCRATDNHTTTNEHMYHEVANTAAPTTPCPAITGAQEGDAVNAAWIHFEGVAEAYCKKGKCKTQDKTCKATFEENRKSKKLLPIRREFIPLGANRELGTLRCYVTIEVSADIKCNCG